MKNSYFGQPKSRSYRPDSDWEIAEEISPDPFSEVEHTRIHARRFKYPKNHSGMKNQENKKNIEQT
ncbi:MAG: hypothetical protein PHR24_03845 [Oscillospiraceae bacterium]|jgi:hypothetical protein|nr:hypothetical protein [Oscillospiraceae bacterium]MDD4546405.1 hypothetical protein [Oscillospiraceae bacterium]